MKIVEHPPYDWIPRNFKLLRASILGLCRYDMAHEDFQTTMLGEHLAVTKGI